MFTSLNLIVFHMWLHLETMCNIKEL